MDQIRGQVEFEKKVRSLMCEGDFYRLVNPYDSNYCSWETVSKDKKRVFLFAGKSTAIAYDKNPKIKLQGLCPDKLYKNTANGKIYGGDLLGTGGLHGGEAVDVSLLRKTGPYDLLHHLAGNLH